MMTELIPDDVREFILEHIDSVAEIEALILLRKHPDQNWTVSDVSKRLYIGEGPAVEVLERLAAAGFCTWSGRTFRYGPRISPQFCIIDRLADTYGSYLIPVTNLIHEKPARIRKFADAFRFRKGK